MSEDLSPADIAAAGTHVAPNFHALVQKYVEHWARQASDSRGFAECAQSIKTAVDLHLTTLAEQVVICLFAGEAASSLWRVPHAYDVVAFSTLPCRTDEAPAVIERMIADPLPYTEWSLRLIAKSVEPYSQWQLRHFIHLVALCMDDHVWLHLGVLPGEVLKDAAVNGYRMYPADLLGKAERERVIKKSAGSA